MYNFSRSLADILAPLVGRTEHHVDNSKDLVKSLQSLTVNGDETLVSFDVVSLFTNTPIDRALEIIKDRLLNDNKLRQRTLLTASDIMELLSLVLTTTYFRFDDQLYQQKFGTAMGSPVSPIVANLFMENLEQTAIATADEDIKPMWWKRYVDDVVTKIKCGTVERLNDHLNQVDTTRSIVFTHETMVENKIPFLDTLIEIKDNGSLKTTVYRKSTHTNQYLNFESHHPTVHKLGVVRTLLDRMDTVVTEELDKETEERTIVEALTTCNYPKWAIQEVKRKKKDTNNKKSRKTAEKDSKGARGMVVLPYVKGLSERMAKVLKDHKICSAFKPYKTLRKILVHPKDKIIQEEVCGSVYSIGCKNCPSLYIGESGRKFGTRLKEHQRNVETHDHKNVRTRATRLSTTEVHQSAITDHMNNLNHVPDWDSAKVVCKESNLLDRQILESITIRRTEENMNRDEGAYQLSHAYDNLLRPRAAPNHRARPRPPPNNKH